MATVADTITAMMFDLGLLQSGEVPSPDDQSIAFSRLNDWIDSLKTDGLSTYSIPRTLWTINGATTYTIGTGATINIARPVNPQQIQAIGIVDNSVSPAQEILVRLFTEAQWEGIVQKSFSADSYPMGFYYDPTYSSSSQYGTIYPWPIITKTSLQGVIYTQGLIGEFTAPTDIIYLPPGYRRFFRTNGAMEIAAAFDVEPKNTLVKAAQESMAGVKRSNYRQEEMTIPAAAMFGGEWQNINIYTGLE